MTGNKQSSAYDLELQFQGGRHRQKSDIGFVVAVLFLLCLREETQLVTLSFKRQFFLWMQVNWITQAKKNP